MSVISRNHRSMQKHLYTQLSRTPSLCERTHTVMGLYSNHKCILMCIFYAVIHTVSVATAILHKVIPGAQVSLILWLQYQLCALCLCLFALKKVCTGKCTVHKTQREPWRQKNKVTHKLDQSIVAGSRSTWRSCNYGNGDDHRNCWLDLFYVT